jgi:hypothetical protein
VVVVVRRRRGRGQGGGGRGRGRGGRGGRIRGGVVECECVHAVGKGADALEKRPRHHFGHPLFQRREFMFGSNTSKMSNCNQHRMQRTRHQTLKRVEDACQMKGKGEVLAGTKTLTNARYFLCSVHISHTYLGTIAGNRRNVTQCAQHHGAEAKRQLRDAGRGGHKNAEAAAAAAARRRQSDCAQINRKRKSKKNGIIHKQNQMREERACIAQRKNV